MLNIPSLEKLVHELSRLPGVGPKSAQRLAYYILRSTNNYPARLTEAIQRVIAEVKTCEICFNYTDQVICKFCSDSHRQDDVLCVVEEPTDILRIESSGAFRGRYHVLHGVLSPLEGIGPQQLKVSELIHRVKQNFSTEEIRAPIREVIMALDTDLEGDTTVLYLAKQLSNCDVRISRLAHGVPIGSDLDYVDDRTMNRALENRVEL